MIGIGFIEGRLRTGWLGRNRHDRRKDCDQAAEAGEKSQSSLHYPRCIEQVPGKTGRGNHGIHPRRERIEFCDVALAV
jgi:hypothetical protein